MSFGADLEKFAKKTMDKHVKVKRASSFDLFSAVILGTPVDKGVLRNNWFVQMGTPSSETTTYGAPVGTATINRTKMRLEATTGEDDITFVNNLPYGIPIEFDGYSGKAPAGMVRINTVRWDYIVALNVRKFNK
ncbi:tail completion or Neck1 protein [Vibrio phage K251 g3]